MIIFGITKANHVMRRHSELVKSGFQAGFLVYSRREHHYRTLIENDVEFKAEFADGIQHCTLVGLPCGNNTPPYRKRNLEFSQTRKETLGRWFAEESFLP